MNDGSWWTKCHQIWGLENLRRHDATSSDLHPFLSTSSESMSLWGCASTTFHEHCFAADSDPPMQCPQCEQRFPLKQTDSENSWRFLATLRLWAANLFDCVCLGTLSNSNLWLYSNMHTIAHLVETKVIYSIYHDPFRSIRPLTFEK